MRLRGIIEGILYRVADTKGCTMGGGGIVKGILYSVANTKGGVRREGVLLEVYCNVSIIPRVV